VFIAEESMRMCLTEEFALTNVPKNFINKVKFNQIIFFFNIKIFI